MAVGGLGGQAASATVGGHMVSADVGGMFVVPPLYSFAAHIVSGTGTTAKYSVGCIYAEIEADLV